MAKPVERSPGHWRLRVYVGRDGRGKAVYASRSFRADGKRDAARKAEAIASELRAGRPERGTVAALVEEYAGSTRGRSKSPSTVYGDQARIARILTDWGQVQVHAITPSGLERWYAELQDERKPNGQPARSVSTVQHYARIMTAHLRYAEKHGWIARSPDRRAEVPKARKAVIESPPTEVVRKLLELAEAHSPNLAVAGWLGAGAGMRRGEVCGLRWRDVDLPGLTVLVGKTVVTSNRGPVEADRVKGGMVTRRIVIPEAVAYRLAEHRARLEEWARRAGVALADDAFVLTDELDPTGRTFWPLNSLSSAWRTVERRARVSCNFHNLRHWHGSNLVAGGMSPADTAAQLGHSRTTTTIDFYTHPVDRTSARAIIGGLLED